MQVAKKFAGKFHRRINSHTRLECGRKTAKAVKVSAMVRLGYKPSILSADIEAAKTDPYPLLHD